MERNWLNILTEGATKTAAPIFMLFILTLLTLGTSWLLDLTAHLHGYHLNDPAAPDTIGLQMPRIHGVTLRFCITPLFGF